jgi:pyruvate dehydrogenase E1 component alpha subunit
VGDPQTYKTKEEMEDYKAQDPIVLFRGRVQKQDLIPEAELARIDHWAEDVVAEAVRFAEESPYPALEECLADVYASYPREEVER